jgi:MoaA/NifB/PqqE/SkfB family radical SAM enzyme
MNKFIDPTGKLLHHVDRIAEIKAGGKPAPVNVEIDPSNRCNLGCAGCHFAYTHTRGPLAGSKRGAGVGGSGDILDADMITHALLDMKVFGVRSVTWSGGGEPTIHPDFDYLVESCPMPQGIYTNGTLINPRRAALMKKRMEWVYISLDRHDRGSYREYKRTDGFDQAVAGIRNLVAADGSATIGVGFLLSEQNVDYIPDMVRMRRFLGVDYVQFRPEINYNVDSPQSNPGNTGWVARAIEKLREVENRESVIVDLERFDMYRRWLIHPYKTCYWVQMQTVITPDGSVWQCCNRRGFDESKLGNLHEEPFALIWTRSKAHTVNERCRVMCRGHIPNLTLDEIMREPSGHDLFV